MQLKSFAILAVTLAVTAVASSATEQAVAPGSMCQPQTPGASYLVWDGVIYNTSSTSWLTVECPYIRQEPTTTPHSAYVTVINGAGASNMSCTVEAHAGTSSAITYATQYASSWSTYQTLMFDPLPAAPTSDGPAFYELKCSLPPYTSNLSGVQRLHFYEP